MAYTNGTYVNGMPNGHHEVHSATEQKEYDLLQSGNQKATDGIPPAAAYTNPEHMKNITVPLNDVPAFTPRKKLRIVTIGAGYAGMTLAQKLQHKYAEEMKNIVDHTIFESKDCVGGTWVANTYPGVMCDVPAMIYVCPLRLGDSSRG